jgi:7-cyano-7-deazaguanine synthase
MNVAVVSGGMDSITMLYQMHDMLGGSGEDIRVLSFDYGQKHKKELDFVQFHCDNLQISHWDVIDLSSITKLLSKSALVGTSNVPEGHYAAENMKATVVPNRNMIMASIAAAALINDGGYLLGLGVHSGDHAIYPDCREEFIRALEATLHIANRGFIHPQFQIFAPWLNVPKHIIAGRGVEQYNIDYTQTWSCYKGLEKHCGKCGTCVERKEAFFLAKIADPTDYLETGVGGHYAREGGLSCTFGEALDYAQSFVRRNPGTYPPSSIYAEREISYDETGPFSNPVPNADGNLAGDVFMKITQEEK